MQKRKSFKVIHGQKKKNKAPKKVLVYLLGAIILLIILQAGFNFARGKVVAAFVRTAISEEDILETIYPVNGVIVRDEKVVAAPATGTLAWDVAEGTRLHINAIVATISSPGGFSQKVSTSRPGIVVMHLDGLEAILQPHQIKDLDMSDLKQYKKRKPEKIPDGRQVQQGTMVFKVVDNYGWYFVIDADEDDYAALGEQQSFRLRFAFNENDDAQGQRITSLESPQSGIVLEIKEDIAGSLTERFTHAEIITRTRGTIVPASALVYQDGEPGIYILLKSVVRFRPVEVLDTGDKYMAISGVGSGVRVISNPSLVREGMRL